MWGKMAQLQHLNTSRLYSSETLKVSASELEVLGHLSEEKDENAGATHPTKEVDESDSAVPILEAPPDGGLAAWLQGKPLTIQCSRNDF